MSSHAVLELSGGDLEICATAVVSAVITRPWLPAKGVEQRTVASECKVVFFVCEVGEHQCTGFGGALGEVADVKRVPSLRGLHNL